MPARGTRVDPGVTQNRGMHAAGSLQRSGLTVRKACAAARGPVMTSIEKPAACRAAEGSPTPNHAAAGVPNNHTAPISLAQS